MSQYSEIITQLEGALQKAKQLDSNTSTDDLDRENDDNSMRRYIETARTLAEEIALENRERKRRAIEPAKKKK